MFRVFFAIAALCLLVSARSTEGEAALPALENGSISAVYSIHWGPLRIADISLTWTLDGADYAVLMTARTRGLLRAIVKADSQLNAHGSTSEDGALKPHEFTIDNLVNKKVFARDMRFDALNNAEITRLVRPKDYRIKRTSIPKALQHGPDPLTAILDFMRADGSRNAVHSFDGVQVLSTSVICDAQPEQLKKSRRTIFYGQAERCQLSGEVLAGDVIEDEDDDTEDVDGRDYKTTLWFAPTADNALRLPVRIDAAGKRGSVKIYLREVGTGLSS